MTLGKAWHPSALSTWPAESLLKGECKADAERERAPGTSAPIPSDVSVLHSSIALDSIYKKSITTLKKSIKTSGLDDSKNFHYQIIKVLRVPLTHLISLQVGKLRPRSSLVEGEEHQARDPEAWTPFQLCHQVLGGFGRDLSLGLISQGFRLELGQPGVPGWVGDKEGKDTNCHRPGAGVLGGNLKHLYLYLENVGVLGRTMQNSLEF